MEDQIKDTNNSDSASPLYPEKKAGSPLIALMFSLVPVVYVSIILFTGVALLILSILIFPIILFVFVAPVIGMIKGISFLNRGEGNKAEKIIAISAIALPIVSVVFTVIYFSNYPTSITFSM